MKEIHQKILDFVTGYLLECGYPPTNRKIQMESVMHPPQRYLTTCGICGKPD